MQATEVFGRKHKVAKISLTEHLCVPAEMFLHLGSGPQVSPHPRRETVEPFLISFGQRMSSPQHPVSETGQFLFGSGYCLFNLLSARIAQRTSAGEVVPTALPAVPSTRFSERARCMEFQVEFHARLGSQCRKGTIPSVVTSNKYPA